MNEKYIAILHTDDYRGDHAADVEYVYDLTPETAISEIAGKINRDQDWIEIKRIVKPKDGEGWKKTK